MASVGAPPNKNPSYAVGYMRCPNTIFFLSLAFNIMYGHRYDCRSFFSTSLYPSPRPLSVQYFSSLIGTRLSILFSVVLSSFSLAYPSLTLSSECVLHLPHHMTVPVQSSLRDLFGSLPHSRCLSDVLITLNGALAEEHYDISASNIFIIARRIDIGNFHTH